MTTLIADRWSGSTFCELMCWQGWLRSISKNYSKVIVVTDKDRAFLYNDFATALTDSKDGLITRGCRVVNEDSAPILFHGMDPYILDQEHKSLGNLGPIHDRDRDALEYEVAIDAPLQVGYSRKEWARFSAGVSERKDIAWLADRQDSHSIYGYDGRKLGLDAKLEVIKKSKLVVALTEGTAALASLAEVPFITFFRKEDHAMWGTYWNPLKTPCIFYRGKPTMNQLIEAREKLLLLWDRSSHEPPAYQDQQPSSGG